MISLAVLGKRLRLIRPANEETEWANHAKILRAYDFNEIDEATVYMLQRTFTPRINRQTRRRSTPPQATARSRSRTKRRAKAAARSRRRTRASRSTDRVGRVAVTVYGRWGSEPHGWYSSVEEANAAAERASASDPKNEYAVEKGPPGSPARIYKAGKYIGMG